MASVQERLQLNRMPLDKWTTREQLCLASAVSCSGDQNWMSVSRTLKLVCASANRPADWYSQKSCAVQYGHLLENVETPKRKKRTSESGVASPATVETPTDLILRRLTEERVQELKAEIRKEQEEYSKIYTELKSMEAGKLSDEQLQDIWRDIEKQQETKRIEEMKLENQMREREQRRQELQRNWRSSVGQNASGTINAGAGGPGLTPIKVTDTSAMDMDVEEIIGTTKVLPNAANTSGFTQQQQQLQQPATSPLLSSLLKSPTSNAPPASAALLNTSVTARATAPTITTLLTSGSIPNSNQPAITLKSNILTSNEAAQLLTRPISGPPTEGTNVTAVAMAQSLLSPSQSAPTLSMLLEKNKHTTAATTTASANVSHPESKSTAQTGESLHTTDSNNEEVPMDIEEDVGVSVVNAIDDDLATGDSDEPDANEEQQLMEVFKNIGNIDELDIDVAAVIDDGGVDFLKGVDDEPPHDAVDVIEFDSKLEATTTSPLSEEILDLKNDIKVEPTEAITDTKLDVNKGDVATAAIKQETTTKVETISSDDSNDNIPLSAVASLDRISAPESSNDEKPFLKEKQESAVKDEDSKGNVSHEIKKSSTPTIKNEDEEQLEAVGDDEYTVESKPNQSTAATENVEEQKSPIESENSDVIVIPTDDDDESNEEKPGEEQKEHQTTDVIMEETELSNAPSEEDVKKNANKEETIDSGDTKSSDKVTNIEEHATAQLEDVDYDANLRPPPIITIDTDDSSTTDVSVSTARKEEKLPSATTTTGKLINQQQQQRKSLQDSVRHEQKLDDESAANSAFSTTVPIGATTSVSNATPVRPPMLRKLRDRDRSESPMIEDEATTTSDHSTTNQRSRRRYSSTPLLDSIPNSPASSERDERETRASKKLLLGIYNNLQPHKHAVALQRALNDETSPKYSEICLRPMDWSTIKRNIDSGVIRSVSELQRDIMLMCQNALMVSKSTSNVHKATLAFLQECQSVREFSGHIHFTDAAIGKVDKESKEQHQKSTSSTSSSYASSGGSGGGSSSAVKARTGSRKSQRIS